MPERLREASVHGRFQPLHNGHMEYLRAARERCCFLWVGIAAPDPEEARRFRNTAREQLNSNPLTYFERVAILTAALLEDGMSLAEFRVVPFPIETPHRLTNYVPVSVPCLTTIYEEWNREKVRLLRTVGYTVEVLYERDVKVISGAEIRENIAKGGDRWMGLVPRATAEAIRAYDIRPRLIRLTELDERP